MRNRLIIFILVFCSTFTFGQISVKINLPAQIKTNSETIFEAKIWKGPVNNFSKYQMELPTGIEVSEIDIKSGSFVREGTLVKIIWAITPTENEFTISLKLRANYVTGNKTIHHKYVYLEKGEKREIEMAPVNIAFVDSASSAPAATDENIPATPPPAGAEELKQQAVQLKRDAKDARKAGEAEKNLAQKKMEEAELAIQKAQTISNEKERDDTLQLALAAKNKAKIDLEVANRILALAKSLEDNAAEIEKLSQSLDSVKAVPGQTFIKDENKQSTVHSTPNEKNEQITEERTRQNDINKGLNGVKGLYTPVLVKERDSKELTMQAAQIKKDAIDAQAIGIHEQKKAKEKLSGAYEALKKAEYIDNSEEKKKAVEKANNDKIRAEKDLEVASKILVLAQSLKQNANEIEAFNKPLLATAQGITDTLQTSHALVTQNTKETLVKQGQKNEMLADVESLKEIFRESNLETEALVYRLQLGAFAKAPDKTQLRHIGKVDIVKEGNMFKAFYGRFASRGEAVVKQNEMRSKGFSPFIVVFKNGVKIK